MSLTEPHLTPQCFEEGFNNRTQLGKPELENNLLPHHTALDFLWQEE